MRTAIIWIDMGEVGVHALRLRATGTRETSAFASHWHVNLQGDGRAHTYLFWVDARTELLSEVPTVQAPEHLIVTIGDWQIVHGPQKETGRPARWMVRIEIEQQPNEVRLDWTGNDLIEINFTESPIVRLYVGATPFT